MAKTKCVYCNGTGLKPDEEECPACHGNGSYEVNITDRDIQCIFGGGY